MSSEEDAFNPQRITLIKEIAKIVWGAKSLEEVKKKLRTYILGIFGVPED